MRTAGCRRAAAGEGSPTLPPSRHLGGRNECIVPAYDHLEWHSRRGPRIPPALASIPMPAPEAAEGIHGVPR